MKDPRCKQERAHDAHRFMNGFGIINCPGMPVQYDQPPPRPQAAAPDLRNVRLVVSPRPSEQKIEVDGVPLMSVRHISVAAGVNEKPTIVLDLAVVDATIEGQARIRIPDSVREDLLALGWIPLREVKAYVWTDPGSGQVCYLHPHDVQVQTLP